MRWSNNHRLFHGQEPALKMTKTIELLCILSSLSSVAVSSSPCKWRCEGSLPIHKNQFVQELEFKAQLAPG
jgi:hypothetical protein